MEVKIKGVKGLEESLTRYLQEIKDDEAILTAIGDKAVSYIVASTKVGNDGYSRFDVNDDWAEERARLARFNQTSEFYKGSVAMTSGFRSSFNDKHKSGNLKGVSKTGKLSKAAQDRNTSTGDAKTAANLTFTGQLLASLKYSIVKGFGLKMFFDGVHKPYRGADRKAVGNPVANQTIADGLSQKREIVFLSDALKTQLESILVREVRRKISLYQALVRKSGKSNE